MLTKELQNITTNLSRLEEMYGEFNDNDDDDELIYNKILINTKLKERILHIMFNICNQ